MWIAKLSSLTIRTGSVSELRECFANILTVIGKLAGVNERLCLEDKSLRGRRHATGFLKLGFKFCDGDLLQAYCFDG